MSSPSPIPDARRLRLFEAITTTTPDFVYVFDREGRFQFANRRLLEVWGMELPRILGKTCLELGYERWHHDMHMREIAEVIATKQAIKGEVPFKAPLTGVFGVYEYIFSPVLDAAGEVELISGTTRDVTDRKQAEEALRDSEQRYRSVVENMSEGLMVFDPEGNLIYQNGASLRIHGFEELEKGILAREKVPQTWLAWDENGRPLGFDDWPVARVFRRERFQNQVLRVVRVETGLEFFGSYNGSPILDGEGRLVLGFITIREITAQVRAQEALAANERRLRSFFESELMGAMYWNVDGAITGANDKFLRMIGYDREDLAAARINWPQITPPEYHARDQQAVAELSRKGVGTIYEKEFFRKDGTRVPVLIGGVILEENHRDGVAFVLDITDRRRAETAATELRRKLDAALLAGEVGSFEWLVVEDRLWGDRNFGRIFGLLLDPLGHAPLADYIAAIHPEDRASVVARIQHTVDTGCPYEAEYRIVNGDRVRWVVARGTGERDADGKVVRFPGVLMDVTARKQAEEALREGERRFRALAESGPQLVWTTDAAGLLDYVNERWCAFTGQTPSEAKGEGWIQVVHPEDRSLAASRWAAALATGTPYEAQYRLLGHDGGARWFLARGVPLRDPAGRITNWFGTNTDIDEQKLTFDALHRSERELVLAKDELARLNIELEKTVEDRTARLRDTVAELEHFSYTITHDMRAPLRALQAFGQMLHEDYGGRLDEAGRDYLRRIVAAAERMDHLITDSLNYAKAMQSELVLEEVDTAALLRGIVESYPQFQAPHSLVELAPELPPVLANPAGLTQCVSNLLGNAVKFVAPGVQPRVRVRAEERGGRVRLWFEDNGIGVPPEQQERIFVMFQRLSRAYEGTGVGLALVRKVVTKMRGSVGLESRPGEGARFWIELQKA